MPEFKVNDFITLKSEHGKNNIYVGGEIFKQCKYLMLNASIDEPDKLIGMQSVDEVADALGWSDEGQIDVKYEIDSGEFWGYCSSLQAWYEHEYDARLLHSSLAFPLLKKLIEVGDPLAKKVFKDEIAKRLKSGYPNVAIYIVKERFLNYFNEEERKQLIKESFPVILKSFGKLQTKALLTNSGAFRVLFKVAKESNLIKELFYAFIGAINETPDALKRYMFSELLEVAKENNLIKEHFLTFLKFTKNKNITFNRQYQNDALSDLFKTLQEAGLKKEFFPSFLETIFKLTPKWTYNLNILKTVREAKWLEEYFSVFLEKMYLLDGYDKRNIISLLVRVFKEGGLKKEIFIVFWDALEQLGNEKYHAFYGLIDSIKNTEIFKVYNSEIRTQFLVLLNDIYTLPNEYHTFNRLIDSIKNTEIVNECNSEIKSQFLVLLKRIENLPEKDKFQASHYLFEVAKEKEWLEEFFPQLIKPYEKFAGLNQYDAFVKLFDFFNSNELLDRYNSKLEPIFTILLANIENLPAEERVNFVYTSLNIIAKKTGWIEEHFLEFLKLPGTLHHLIDLFEGTKVITKYLPQIEKEFLARLNDLENYNRSDRIGQFAYLVEYIIKTELLDTFYSQIETEFIPLWNSLTDGCLDDSLSAFITISKKLGLIKKYFPVLVKIICDMEEWQDLFVFQVLLGVAKEEDWIEEYFFVFLESIDKISDYHKVHAFEQFIKEIKSLDIRKKYSSQIENKFLSIVEMIGEIDDHEAFSNILKVAKDCNFIKTKNHFFVLLKQIKKIYNLKSKKKAFSELYTIATEKKRIDELFPVFLKFVSELYGADKYRLFSDLIGKIKHTRLIIKYESLITTHFLTLLNTIDSLEDPKGVYDDDYSYYDDVRIVDIHGNTIEPFSHLQYSAFNTLINSIKGTKLLELLYPQITTQFQVLLKRIDNLCETQNINSKFGNEEGVKKFDCRNLIEAIEGTNMENEIEFKEWKRKNLL